jgi:hypothetical protein
VPVAGTGRALSGAADTVRAAHKRLGKHQVLVVESTEPPLDLSALGFGSDHTPCSFREIWACKI